MLEIVSYCDALQKGVIDLILPIQREEFGFDIQVADQPDLLDVANFYQSGSGGLWVALEDDAVVGSIALRDIGNAQGALRKMFVRQSHRGRQHAVAARLLDRLVSAAAASQVQELFLGTTEKFLAAHRFYEKHGFSPIAPERLPQAFPRMSLDTRFYYRKL